MTRLAFQLVKQFNRPEANVTGIYIATTELDVKRLQVLAEAVPSAQVVAALLNDEIRLSRNKRRISRQPQPS